MNRRNEEMDRWIGGTRVGRERRDKEAGSVTAVQEEK